MQHKYIYIYINSCTSYERARKKYILHKEARLKRIQTLGSHVLTSIPGAPHGVNTLNAYIWPEPAEPGFIRQCNLHVGGCLNWYHVFRITTEYVWKVNERQSKKNAVCISNAKFGGHVLEKSSSLIRTYIYSCLYILYELGIAYPISLERRL